MSGERVVVTGGRGFIGRDEIFYALDDVRPVALASGGATGVDAIAKDYAEARGIPFTEYPADWRTHGRRAGPLRNRTMLDGFKPDLVLAFPGGRGTADCVRQARAAGIPVIEMVP